MTLVIILFIVMQRTKVLTTNLFMNLRLDENTDRIMDSRRS